MSSTKIFDPANSIRRAKGTKTRKPEWSITVDDGKYTWSNRMERVEIIRSKLPYDAVEAISRKANLTIKQLLQLLGMPQTTYNKKRRGGELLSSRDSEVLLVLAELIDYGLSVFNHEDDKFYRWLKKPNISLGGVTPESLFDTLSGIQEVKAALTRIEYGNLA